MARILKSISFAFSEEMLEKLEERALSLGIGRSAYLRQLVADDILKAGGMEPAGKLSIAERLINAENLLRDHKSQIDELRALVDSLTVKMS